jgi:hypothetical protein
MYYLEVTIQFQPVVPVLTSCVRLQTPQHDLLHLCHPRSSFPRSLKRRNLLQSSPASTADDRKSISLCAHYSGIRRTREPNYSSILNIEIVHHSLSGSTPILKDSASKTRRMNSRVERFSPAKNQARNENKGVFRAQRP